MRIYILLLAALTCAGSASAQKKTTPKARVMQNETLVITPSGEKTTIEVSKDGVYVDGKLVATKTELNNNNLKKKIIINSDGENMFSPRKTAMLGVQVKNSDDGRDGALVAEVNEGSAAETAGLQKGDVITEINGKKINDYVELTKTVREYDPGTEVTVKYLRDDKEHTATAKLDAMQSLGGTLRLYDNNGENGTDFDFEMPRSMMPNMMERPIMPAWPPVMKPKLGVSVEDNEDAAGARVVGVKENSPAEKNDIREGDIITQIDNENISGAEDLQETIAGKKAGSTVKAEIMRGKVRIYKDIKLYKEKIVRDM